MKEIVLIVSIGCTLETAAEYASCQVDDIHLAVMRCHDFARDLARARIGIEVAHMRNVQQAGRDERHWRASIWWLERRAPERYARTNDRRPSEAELKRFMNQLAEAISSEVSSESDRLRLLDRIDHIAQEMEQAARPLLEKPTNDRASVDQPLEGAE